jgi:hypothetical protein
MRLLKETIQKFFRMFELQKYKIWKSLGAVWYRVFNKIWAYIWLRTCLYSQSLRALEYERTYLTSVPTIRADTINIFFFSPFWVSWLCRCDVKQEKWLREKLREEIYEFRWRGKKIINEKYMKEEACKTVLVVDMASVPMHPNPLSLTTDPARWCVARVGSLVQWTWAT